MASGQMIIPGMEEFSEELKKEQEKRKKLLKEAVDYWKKAEDFTLFVGDCCLAINRWEAYVEAKKEKDWATVEKIEREVISVYYKKTGAMGLKTTAETRRRELENNRIPFFNVACGSLDTPVQSIDWPWVETHLLNRQARKNFLSRLRTRLDHAKEGNLEKGSPISLRDV